MAVAEFDEPIERAAGVACHYAVRAENVHEYVAPPLEQASTRVY